MKRMLSRLALIVAVFFVGIASASEPVKLAEGTDVKLQLVEKLTSATAAEGQRFNLILDEDIRVNGVVVVPHGAKAVGTVISAKKRGYMGKAGDLSIQINYLLIGEQRVPLRATSSREGDAKVGATVALTVLFGPIGLLKRGKNVEINSGTIINAFVDATTVLESVPAVVAGGT